MERIVIYRVSSGGPATCVVLHLELTLVGGYNRTALQAASHTSLDAVKLLLDNGADPDLHGERTRA
jgi:hypothetical protein